MAAAQYTTCAGMSFSFKKRANAVQLLTAQSVCVRLSVMEWYGAIRLHLLIINLLTDARFEFCWKNFASDLDITLGQTGISQEM